MIRHEEYDENYFDAKGSSNAHPAGYTSYERNSSLRHASLIDSGIDQGEEFKTQAKQLAVDLELQQGDKIIDFGCAKGFLVEDLTSFGFDCYGVDVSSYAIGCASKRIANRLTISDATEYLENLSDGHFDWGIGLQFLPCLTESEVTAFLVEANRVCKKLYFSLDELTGLESYYNVDTPSEWSRKHSFKKDTVIDEVDPRDILQTKGREKIGTISRDTTGKR